MFLISGDGAAFHSSTRATQCLAMSRRVLMMGRELQSFHVLRHRIFPFFLAGMNFPASDLEPKHRNRYPSRHLFQNSSIVLILKTSSSSGDGHYE